MPENAVAKPNAHRREEKLWSEIKNYQVATNNARILGVLDELIINEKTGKRRSKDEDLFGL
jgi:sporulation protein YlmC with PRC-barrel domain